MATVTPLEDPTNSFVEIASALIHDCLVGTEHAFSTTSLVSLSIQSADLQDQRCLSRLAELRDAIFEGRDALPQLGHALRQVSEVWNRRGGHARRGDFHFGFGEFVREVRHGLHDPPALRGHRDRICAFLGVRVRGEEAAVLYDTLRGLSALLQGRQNHGSVHPRLVSLHYPHSEELTMPRDVICGLLPGPSILTFETAVRRFFVPLLATRSMVAFFREHRELGRMCERVAFGEREAVDEACGALRRIVEGGGLPPPQRRRHDPAPYRTRHHIHHMHWCRDSATCRRRGAEPRRPQFPYPPFNPVNPLYDTPPSPIIPPDPSPRISHTSTGRFVYRP